MGIYIEKTVGGYVASVSPPQSWADWRTPAVYSREAVIEALGDRGASQADIAEAFRVADEYEQAAEETGQNSASRSGSTIG